MSWKIDVKQVRTLIPPVKSKAEEKKTKMGDKIE